MTQANAPTKPNAGALAIRRAFAAARGDSRCALLPFITAGYPDLATTAELLRALPDAGADAIELGFPFSDPIADGPVIAESMHRALLAGVTPESIFQTVAAVRPRVPVLAMVSVSIVERMGAESFIARAIDSGFAGFIVPDADPTAAVALSRLAATHGGAFCALVSPTTREARLRELVSISSGFVYLLARAGVTGVSTSAPEIADRCAQIRGITDAPVAAGFGIATPEHVRAVGAHADGAIVGSAIVRAMTDAIEKNESAAEAALSLVRSMRAGARQ